MSNILIISDQNLGEQVNSKFGNNLPTSSIVPTSDDQLVNKKYVDDEISSKISSVFRIKGSCTNSELSSKTKVVGDVWFVSDDNNKEYVCVNKGTEQSPDLQWELLGFQIDLSNYVLKSEATGYGDILTKTEASNTYAAKPVVDNNGVTFTLATGYSLVISSSGAISVNVPD